MAVRTGAVFARLLYFVLSGFNLFGKSFSSNGKSLSSIEVTGRLIGGYICLNLMLIWAAKIYLINRPLFNLDYLVVAIVYVWISRTIAAVFFTGLLAVEIVQMFISIYFYSKQALSIAFWLRSAATWPVIIIAEGVLGTLVFLWASVVLFRRYDVTKANRKTVTISVFVVALLLVALDWLNGTSEMSSADAIRLDVNVSTSVARTVFWNTWGALSNERPAVFKRIAINESATGRYFLNSCTAPGARERLKQTATFSNAESCLARIPDKLVLVIVESLSVLSADPQLERWREPFERLSGRYTIESGSFEWKGATLRGEVRELCWSSLDGLEIASLPESLPVFLKNRKYQTSAFHGYYSGMYDRRKLYPLLGFDRRFFLQNMKKEGIVPLAGIIFQGAQDRFVAGLVHKEILRPGKRFVYWLTLSGHIPMDGHYAKQIATPSELSRAAEEPDAIWANTVISRRALESVANIAADESLQNCDFVIVGDHALALRSEEAGNNYLHNRVPYLILRSLRRSETESVPVNVPSSTSGRQ